MTSTIKLTAGILTLNEADRIEPCLKSLAGLADEILVLDCGSTDNTVAICQQHGATVIQTDWPGEGIQRQRALDAANGEWFLWLDADERVTPELSNDIQTALQTTNSPNTGYQLDWITHYFGKTCIHGGLGDGHIRLFKRNAASFNTTTLVHPKVTLTPRKIGHLKGRLLHYSFRDFKHVLNKNTDYSLRSAAEKTAKGKSSSIGKATVHAAWRFIQVWVVNRGILDGQRGFLNAVLAAQYVFNKYAAVWAQQHPNQPD